MMRTSFRECWICRVRIVKVDLGEVDFHVRMWGEEDEDEEDEDEEDEDENDHVL